MTGTFPSSAGGSADHEMCDEREVDVGAYPETDGDRYTPSSIAFDVGGDPPHASSRRGALRTTFPTCGVRRIPSNVKSYTWRWRGS